MCDMYTPCLIAILQEQDTWKRRGISFLLHHGKQETRLWWTYGKDKERVSLMLIETCQTPWVCFNESKLAISKSSVNMVKFHYVKNTHLCTCTRKIKNTIFCLHMDRWWMSTKLHLIWCTLGKSPFKKWTVYLPSVNQTPNVFSGANYKIKGSLKLVFKLKVEADEPHPLLASYTVWPWYSSNISLP